MGYNIIIKDSPLKTILIENLIEKISMELITILLLSDCIPNCPISKTALFCIVISRNKKSMQCLDIHPLDIIEHLAN